MKHHINCFFESRGIGIPMEATKIAPPPLQILMIPQCVLNEHFHLSHLPQEL